jgi:mRNA interferase MazF
MKWENRKKATGRKYYRRDIYYARLDPVTGSEQGGERPVVILQNDKGNRYCKTVIVAPITSRHMKKAQLPTHIPVECHGFEKESMVLIEQIRTIDKSRFTGSVIGQVSDASMVNINMAIIKNLELCKERVKVEEEDDG